MSSRRRPPADLSAVRRSRAGCSGAITKALDKLRAIPIEQTEEVLKIKTKDVERILASIEKTETGFLQTLEDAQSFAPEDEGEEADFQREEDLAADSFMTSLSVTRDLAEQLLAIKAVLVGISNFRCDLDAIQDSLADKPDSNQNSSYSSLQTLFSSLREQWQTADLGGEHPVKTELDACRRALTIMGAEVAAAREKSDSHSSTTSTSSSSSSPCCVSLGRSDLPRIDVPTFNGEIMQWSTFWASFQSTIGDRKELTNTQRLHYLRKAVTDPDIQLLLHSPTETPDMYLEVVQELKSRFNKTREIHRHLTKALISTASPKQTRIELRRLADTVKRTIDSLKSTKYYDLDSFLSSMIYLILPSRLQILWDQHTKKDKGVPPVQQLLLFIRDHAETLPSTHSPPAEKPADTGKKPYRKFDKKEQYQHPKAKGNIHVVTPASTYRWECSLCKPDKHPLHVCPKWSSFNINQRLGHIQAKGLCSNCLAVGHATASCKSIYRCRDCSQPHHTTIHQQPPPAVTSVNYSMSKSSKLPDALMTTAQVFLTGPNGQRMKARALIDSGAGLSLISKRVAQTLELPLEKVNLQLSAVQGEISKPTKHITSVHISPLQNPKKMMLCRPAVSQQVTSDLPPEAIYPVGDLPHLLGLQLADPDYATPGRIDILLGADMAPKIMVKELLRHGTDSQPIAQATEFGWVISGPSQENLLQEHPFLQTIKHRRLSHSWTNC